MYTQWDNKEELAASSWKMKDGFQKIYIYKWVNILYGSNQNRNISKVINLTH